MKPGVFTITIKDTDKTSEFTQLAMFAVAYGASVFPQADSTAYQLASQSKMSQAEFQYLLNEKLTLDYLNAYVEVDFSIMNNLIPVAMADSKAMLDEEEVRVKWEDYTNYWKPSNDGEKAIMRCGHTSMGLLDAELREWIATLGVENLMCQREYNALMLTDNYKAAEV